METIKLNVDEIIVPDRKDAMDDSLDELVEFIKRSGKVTPPVQVVIDNGKYTLMAGSRGLEAAKLAGLKEVEAEIVEQGKLK